MLWHTFLLFLLSDDCHGESGGVGGVGRQTAELHRAERHLERVLDVLLATACLAITLLVCSAAIAASSTR